MVTFLNLLHCYENTSKKVKGQFSVDMVTFIGLRDWVKKMLADTIRRNGPPTQIISWHPPIFFPFYFTFSTLTPTNIC